jgi:cobalt-zinc-cadmium efflux system membrane fusion protein
MTRLLIAALAAAALPLSGCEHKTTSLIETPAAAAPSAQPDTVVIADGSPMLAQIKRQAVATRVLPTDEIVSPGKIEANPNRVSKLVLPVSGRIVNVLVKTGDSVQKNDPLLTIDSPDADAAMSALVTSQASTGQARAGLAKAQADFNRSADLFEHNAIARKEVLSAEAALAQARAALDQALAQQEQATRRLTVLGLTPETVDHRVVLRAPLAGKVLELNAVPGEFRNDLSASVMTIADLSTVWVTSQVPESYIRFVQIGEKVEINLVAFPGEVFEGRVSRIADTLDPQTRTVKVQAEMSNPVGRFKPEMFGSIHHVESSEPMLVVPAASVLQDDQNAVVFVERAPGRFEERKVTLGKRDGDVIRVLHGLSAGDTVVTDGVMLLKGLARRT